ncbi:hypothetical protein [Pleionea sediminis]|uniref:hypothetical protein n=1 Tax=Pleionea sediminis TaxID=2569479 RepID=UPI0011862B8E|nr:hypothetical protein [Pleionea sediminis]
MFLRTTLVLTVICLINGCVLINVDPKRSLANGRTLAIMNLSIDYDRNTAPNLYIYREGANGSRKISIDEPKQQLVTILEPGKYCFKGISASSHHLSFYNYKDWCFLVEPKKVNYIGDIEIVMHWDKRPYLDSIEISDSFSSVKSRFRQDNPTISENLIVNQYQKKPRQLAVDYYPPDPEIIFY